MSIEDRDWYREDFKRRQAIGKPSKPVQQQPLPSISRQPPSLGAGSFLIFGLFLLSFLAVGSFFI